ncbi:hypothetical protein TMAG_01996, partial [Mycobacterium tuberculosis SUMu001]
TPGHLRPAFGGKGGGLFVAGVDQADALLTAAVVDGKQVAARQREDRVDTTGFKSARDKPASMHGLGRGGVGAHIGSLSTTFGYLRPKDFCL